MITFHAEVVILILFLVWLALHIEITPPCPRTVLKATAVGVCITISGTGGNVANAVKTSHPITKNVSGNIDVGGRTGSHWP